MNYRILEITDEDENLCAWSTVSAHISLLDCCGILIPSAGFSSSRRHCNACRIADFNTTCV